MLTGIGAEFYFSAIVQTIPVGIGINWDSFEVDFIPIVETIRVRIRIERVRLLYKNLLAIRQAVFVSIGKESPVSAPSAYMDMLQNAWKKPLSISKEAK